MTTTLDVRYGVTSDGLEGLARRLETMHAQRLRILGLVRESRGTSSTDPADWSHEMVALHNLDAEIDRLEAMMMRAHVLPAPRHITDRVVLGSRVQLECCGETVQVQLVGSLEADPERGYISDQSPMGTALFDKPVGAEFTLGKPSRQKQYRIVAIE